MKNENITWWSLMEKTLNFSDKDWRYFYRPTPSKCWIKVSILSLVPLNLIHFEKFSSSLIFRFVSLSKFLCETFLNFSVREYEKKRKLVFQSFNIKRKISKSMQSLKLETKSWNHCFFFILTFKSRPCPGIFNLALHLFQSKN